MYTPSITSSFKQNGTAYVTVSFSNGSDTVEKQFQVTSLQAPKNRVKAAKDELDLLEATVFSNGEVDLTDVTPTPPSQAEQDKEQWLIDWHNFKGANELIAAGVIADTLPAYVTLKNKVVTGFKNSYVTLL